MKVTCTTRITHGSTTHVYDQKLQQKKFCCEGFDHAHAQIAAAKDPKNSSFGGFRPRIHPDIFKRSTEDWPFQEVSTRARSLEVFLVPPCKCFRTWRPLTATVSHERTNNWYLLVFDQIHDELRIPKIRRKIRRIPGVGNLGEPFTLAFTLGNMVDVDRKCLQWFTFPLVPLRTRYTDTLM